MKTERPTARRVLGMVIGIVIISLGIAIFKQSHLGNDSITALNIRLSELLGISLGVQNICTNLVFLVVEFIWGRKYIGLGTLVNGLGCGFIITFFYDIIAGWFGPAEQLPIQLLWVVIAVPVTAFGCSLYQTAGYPHRFPQRNDLQSRFLPPQTTDTIHHFQIPVHH